MRSGHLALLAAAALGACQGSEPERQAQEPPGAPVASEPAPSTAASVAPAPSEAAPANVPITSVDDLVGEYRVAGAGGREIDLPHGITARIDDNGVIVESGCVKLAWVWFFEGERLVTEQLFPRDSCGRALLPEEEAIAAAFNGATSVGRTAANGIAFGGENGSVLLFSQ